MATIEKRLSRLIVGHLGISSHSVYPYSVLAQDFGADSLDRIKLIMTCEGKFGIKIGAEEAQAAITFQDAVSLITAKTDEAHL